MGGIADGGSVETSVGNIECLADGVWVGTIVGFQVDENGGILAGKFVVITEGFVVGDGICM